jgi:hypothetical protein
MRRALLVPLLLLLSQANAQAADEQAC